MTPDYVRSRLKRDGLAHYASEDQLVNWVARLLKDFVGMARAQGEGRITATEVDARQHGGV